MQREADYTLIVTRTAFCIEQLNYKVKGKCNNYSRPTVLQSLYFSREISPCIPPCTTVWEILTYPHSVKDNLILIKPAAKG